MSLNPQKRYIVIHNGRRIGPLTEREVAEHLKSPVNLRFLTTCGVIFVRHSDETRGREISLVDAIDEAGRKVPITALRILFCLMEKPKRLHTLETLLADLEAKFGHTSLTRYLTWIRWLLGESRSGHPLIRTVTHVDRLASRTGHGFTMDPNCSYQIISYAF